MDERLLPRWEIKKEARVWIQQMEGFSNCIIEDLNLKGMCVSFSERLPRLKSVRMSFAIGDNSEPIKIEAQIPWTREEQGRHFYGLSFSKIDDDGRNRIYQYLSANCYDQFKKKWWGDLVC
jgi:hypothetical protein